MKALAVIIFFTIFVVLALALVVYLWHRWSDQRKMFFARWKVKEVVAHPGVRLSTRGQVVATGRGSIVVYVQRTRDERVEIGRVDLSAENFDDELWRLRGVGEERAATLNAALPRKKEKS